jgi:hypothetical protein
MGLKSEATAHIDALVDWLLPKNRRLRVLSLLLIGAGLGCAALITPFTGAGVLAAAMEHATFRMQAARIEVIRDALAQVPCGVEGVAFQGVIVQAVVHNERIAHEKVANSIWYSDPFSPDDWLDVPLLALPEC